MPSSPPPLPLEYHTAPPAFRPLLFILAATLLSLTPIVSDGISLAISFIRATGRLAYPLPLLQFPTLLVPTLILIAIILLAKALPPPPTATHSRFLPAITLAIFLLVAQSLRYWFNSIDRLALSTSSWSLLLSFSAFIFLLETALLIVAWLFIRRLSDQFHQPRLNRLALCCFPASILASLTIAAILITSAIRILTPAPPLPWLDTLYLFASFTRAILQFLFWTTLSLTAPRLHRPAH